MRRRQQRTPLELLREPRANNNIGDRGKFAIFSKPAETIMFLFDSSGRDRYMFDVTLMQRFAMT
jgi:hypothetical protein